MLKEPPREVLEAMVSLESDTRFKLVRAWLEDSKVAALKVMAFEAGEPVYRAQGAYGVLDDLHNRAVNARKSLEQLSRSM